MQTSYLTVLPPCLRNYFFTNYIAKELLPVITKRTLCSDEIRKAAHYCARYGYLRLLQTLDLRNHGSITTLVISAATNGRLEILQWLHQSGYEFHPAIYGLAARRGHTNIVQWLQQDPITTETFITKLEHLIKDNVEIIAATASEAINTGDIKVLEWLYRHGYKFGFDHCAETFRSNRVDVLRWLHEHNACNNVIALLYYANLYQVPEIVALLEQLLMKMHDIRSK